MQDWGVSTYHVSSWIDNTVVFCSHFYNQFLADVLYFFNHLSNFLFKFSVFTPEVFLLSLGRQFLHPSCWRPVYFLFGVFSTYSQEYLHIRSLFPSRCEAFISNTFVFLFMFCHTQINIYISFSSFKGIAELLVFHCSSGVSFLSFTCKMYVNSLLIIYFRLFSDSVGDHTTQYKILLIYTLNIFLIIFLFLVMKVLPVVSIITWLGCNILSKCSLNSSFSQS